MKTLAKCERFLFVDMKQMFGFKQLKQNSYTDGTYSKLRLAEASRFASVELDV